ncbi:ATP-binding protein [Streptomyces sp. NPDC004031]
MRLNLIHGNGPAPAEGALVMRRRTTSFFMTSEFSAVPTARRRVTQLMTEWDVPLDDESRLALTTVVSELATNAVRHGGGTGFTVRLEARPAARRIRVEIGDDSSSPPRLLKAADDAEDGRGMWLVDQLAAASGCEATPSGKRVWAEIAMAARPFAQAARTPPHPASRCEPTDGESPTTMTLPSICGEAVGLPASLAHRTFELARAHGQAGDIDVPRTVRCHLQAHGAEGHFAHLLDLPGADTGALWARWRTGAPPGVAEVLPDCPVADAGTGEPCCEFADHAGAHSFQLAGAPPERGEG